MLTKLTIENFKRFERVEIELGNPVVFIGPNNSGKSTALQALALWDLGLRRWNEKRSGKALPEHRPGVTINRRELSAVPVPDTNHLWRSLHVRDVRRENGKQVTQNVRIVIQVDGVTNGRAWECGLEFDYANDESLYCRPLRLDDGKRPQRMQVPDEASSVRIAYLPPMSGLTANETRLEMGAINVRLGEGRTAEVLRNLCHQVLQAPEGDERWADICRSIQAQFGVELDAPQHVAERGELTMTYRDRPGVRLDITASGRGLQQTLLLLAHLTVHPGDVLLLDEPDAHLEILRQRQIYQVLTETAVRHGSQIIVTSHSEVILNEAADRDVVVAFVGHPHRIDDRGSQLLKALKEIGFEHYYQAEQRGWVLYLEGSADLAVLLAFARTLQHQAAQLLESPFVHYVANVPSKAREHFRGLCEAKRDLVGFALFDRLPQPLQQGRPELMERTWKRRAIENYLCTEETLVAWASAQLEDELGPLFAQSHGDIMQGTIAEVAAAMITLGKGSPWSADTKVSDDFLEPLFNEFFRKRNMPNLMRKTDYHVLARFMSREQIDPEVTEVLDEIARVAARARPTQHGD